MPGACTAMKCPPSPKMRDASKMHAIAKLSGCKCHLQHFKNCTEDLRHHGSAHVARHSMRAEALFQCLQYSLMRFC